MIAWARRTALVLISHDPRCTSQQFSVNGGERVGVGGNGGRDGT